jgi:hypothetical protein
LQADSALPELASVPWRQRTDARWLRRWARIWHAWTLLYTVPFICAGIAMIWLEPLATPVALAALAHAWIIPELYAFRGASVVRAKRPRAAGASGREAPAAGGEAAAFPGERAAQGLLGDLLGHYERALQRETGLALQRGKLASGCSARAAPCSSRPAAAACTASASRPSTASCPRPTASRTSCSRCASTRRASRPSRTTPSRARRGE